MNAESGGPVGALVLTGGVDAVSAAAPLALWPGAGEGHARRALLRAHPLLVDGVISGAMFGERLAYANAEAQHWFEKPLLVTDWSGVLLPTSRGFGDRCRRRATRFRSTSASVSA